ncbi:MAG: ammonium transporter [Proteobacteria bacterium]|nr:ammonium transporter [Pseudomonadota bacterium]
MLISTALVLLMNGALAFFYGGLVRSRHMLNTLAMSFASFGFVGLAWVLAGYSLSFSPGTSFVGGLQNAMLTGMKLDDLHDTIPTLLFMAYQGTFAIITAALISGAVVERMRFGAYLAFITLWSLAVYAPVAHWVWGPDGWLGARGALDFAGGTVVHVNAGIAALVTAVVLGPRKDFGRRALLPHNVPFVLLGAGLLWFGWFGFNAGSALKADRSATLAFVNTMLAPAATLVVWMTLDILRTRRVTAVGIATGVVVGLVGITPAAGLVSPVEAVIIGLLCTFPSYYAILWRAASSIDDSLDVFSAHGIGGIVGALLTGIFASRTWGAPVDGLIHGNPAQLGIQAMGVVVTAAYSAIVTCALLKIVDAVVPLRVEARDERVGLDVSQHGEEAYSRGEGAILIPAVKEA